MQASCCQQWLALTAADSDTGSDTPCVCVLPWSLQAVQEHGPKSSEFYFAVQTLDCLLEYPLGVIVRWQAGAQIWTLQPDQRVVKVLYALKSLVVKVLYALKSLKKLCGVWILFRSIKNVKIEDSSELISTLIHQTEPVCGWHSEWSCSGWLHTRLSRLVQSECWWTSVAWNKPLWTLWM